jgi:uncharacterized protein
MKYLLDVNSLVALGVLEHEFHERVTAWAEKASSAGSSELATCSITELGFLRTLPQAPQYGFNLSQARDILKRLKSNGALKLTFIDDDQDASNLPAWVSTAKQTTDGHLIQLAASKGAMLATLDRGIPKAFLIPLASVR